MFPFLLLVMFAFSLIELHTDHDTASSAGRDECCVQCCPSHNLAPRPAAEASTSVSDPVEWALSDTSSLYQDPYLTLFDPPPISVLVYFRG